ncbi:hypothetical protein [Haloarchaeobius amylolyticus]|uniref:hypothetical protein n=1 Tax=Haloarchaeobius amylolyticus TaxID=1198296 RepID=UPI00226FCC43|nr:hypothetical protein [Haloarchaeobius amylolyticus]
MHERAVARVEVALHQQFGESAPVETEVNIDVSEVPTPVSERRADALATFTDWNPYFGEGLAVEVQHSHEDKDLQQVTHDYLAAGYSVVWIRAETILRETFDYDTIDAEFKRDDGAGYAQRTSNVHRHTNCQPLLYSGEHAWARVPSYAHPRGMEDLITYDICVDQRCELRRIHEPDGSYTFTGSDEHGPDFPLKALKNAIVREYDQDPFWKWAGRKYHSAQVEKLLAKRPEIERCRGPKGFHEWGRRETLWTNRSGQPRIELRECLYCPVRLVTNHRGRSEHSTFCLYGREPDIDWDDVYFQASPPECDHYLYDQETIEDYCPKCGATIETPDKTLWDYSDQ